MQNEFIYELLEPDPGLEPTLSEAAYMKLPPALRAKYIIQDENKGSEENEILDDDSTMLKLEEQNEMEEQSETTSKKPIFYNRADYDEFEEFKESIGRVKRGYNYEDF